MGTPELEIRRAEPRDMGAVVRLWLDLGEERAAGNQRYELSPDAGAVWGEWAGERLRDESSIILVIVKGDECVGFLLGHVDETRPIFAQRRYANISDLYVQPEHRRRGAATRMVEEALGFFRERGLTDVSLKIMAEYAWSRAFCRKLGFDDVIVRRSIIGVTMWKPLA